MNRDTAWAIVLLIDVENVPDELVNLCSEAENNYTLRLQVIENADGEDEEIAGYSVNAETGRLICEAAKKIIAERRAELGVDMPGDAT